MNRLIRVSIFIVLIIDGRVTAQQPARSGGSQAITGRIINHNGQPLAGGRVHIQKIGGTGNFTDVSANDSGEFRFDNLSPGVYRLYAPGVIDEDQRQRVYRPGDSVTFHLKKGGVITGTVTDSTGEPMIIARVQITRVRDRHGRRINQTNILDYFQDERFTDDRGVYRFWGLAPGSYLVGTGVKHRQPGRYASEAGDNDTPATYHPSAATLDAAVEVSVDEGREATGVDIRLHGQTGHAISGHVSGQVAGDPNESGLLVTLTHASTGAAAAWQALAGADGSNNFVFEGVADGEYDLMALRVTGRDNIDSASPLRRVVIKGEDVKGLEVKLSRLGSIEGRILLEEERKPRCQSKAVMRLNEIVIIAERERAEPRLPALTLHPTNDGKPLAVPDEKGAFAIRFLYAEPYRVETQLPGEEWYIRSINLPGSANAKPIDAGRDGIAVKAGERVTGITITAQEGAAALRGRVLVAQANATLPAGLRVHVVPAEREQSDNALRFAEAPIQNDGSFLLTNVAPGRYWLLVRPAGDVAERSIRPAAWDREARAKLTREAASTDAPIELQPCQRIRDHVLRYTPPGVKR